MATAATGTTSTPECEDCCTTSALWRCAKCNAVLCDTCFDKIHKVSRLLSNHVKVPLPVLGDGSTASVDLIASQCAQHPSRVAEYLCETDSCLICADCAIFGSHHGHRISSVKQQLETISTFIADVNRKALTAIDAETQATRDSEKLCLVDINAGIDRLQSSVEQRRAQLSNEASEKYSGAIADLQRLRDEITDYVAKLRTAGIANPALAQNVMEIISKLTGGQRQPFQLRFSCNTKFTDDISLFGNITVLHTAPVTPPVVPYIPPSPNSSSRHSPAFPAVNHVTTPGLSKPYANAAPNPPSAVNSSLARDFPQSGLPATTTNVPLAERPAKKISVPPGFKADNVCSNLATSSKLGGSTSNLVVLPTQYDVPTGVWQRALVTRIVSPSHFIVQFADDLPKIEWLMSKLNSVERGFDFGRGKQFGAGSMVLAKYTDRRWYRAEVLRAEGDLVEVDFFDYGYTGFVSAADELMDGTPVYYTLPRMSRRCCLDKVVPAFGNTEADESKSQGWQRDAVSAFAEMTGSQPMMIKVKKVAEDVLHVDLSWPEDRDVITDSRVELVSDALVALGLARKPENSGDRPLQSSYVPLKCQVRGATVSATVISYTSLQNFVVQLRRGAHDLQLLMDELQSTYNDGDSVQRYALRSPVADLPCVAKYTVDGLWYRARVRSVHPGGCVELVYVDYGNVEVLPLGDVRKLNKRFLALPAQALVCKSATGDDTYTAALAQQEFLLQQSVEQSAVVKLNIVDVFPGPILAVTVLAETAEPELLAPPPPASVENKSSRSSASPESQSVSANHVEVGAGARADAGADIALSRRLEFIVCHSVSPGEIYLQLKSSDRKRALDRLMRDLNNAELALPVDPCARWTPGQVCVAWRPADERWYRAIVKGHDGDLIVVQMNDFGYDEHVTTDELRPIRPEHMKQQWFAMKCHLAGVRPVAGGRWSQAACELLQTLVIDKPCCFDSKGPNDASNSMPVDLLVVELVPGGALTADTKIYKSIAAILVARQLAVSIIPVENVVPALLEKTSPPPIQQTLVTPPRRSAASVSPVGDMSDAMSSTFMLPVVPRTASIVSVVTHVDPDGTIFMHDMSDGIDLTFISSLCARVDQFYQKTPPQHDVTWTVGAAVAAQFTVDDMFYRGMITSFDDNIRVTYMDFGNSEELPKTRLRLLDNEFRQIPIQCYTCRLHGIAPVTVGGWDPSAIRYIFDTTNGQQLVTHIKEVKRDGTLLVDIEIPGTRRCISDELCGRGYVVRTDSSSLDVLDTINLDSLQISGRPSDNGATSPVSTQRSPLRMDMGAGGDHCAGGHVAMATAVERSEPEPLCYFEPPERMGESPYPARTLPMVDENFCAMVTHVDSPTVVYIQMIALESDDVAQQLINSELDSLRELSLNIHANISDLEPLPAGEFRQGVACIAIYSKDGFPYRGEIISVDSDLELAGIRFIDYGSFEYVGQSSVFAMPRDYLDLPPQSLRCHLAGVSCCSKTTEEMSNVVELMKVLLLDKPIIVIPKSIEYTKLEIFADLFDMNEYKLRGVDATLVYQHLVDGKYMDYKSDSECFDYYCDDDVDPDDEDDN